MPYLRNDRKESNFWFSASDGHTCKEFNDLISPENIEQLKKEGGLCIAFTHFACGFLDASGNLNPTFMERMKHLSEQDAWLAPASDILDFIQTQKTKPNKPISVFYINLIDLKWLFHRLYKKIKYGR